VAVVRCRGADRGATRPAPRDLDALQPALRHPDRARSAHDQGAPYRRDRVSGRSHETGAHRSATRACMRRSRQNCLAGSRIRR
jgi:hypothetical protein